MEKAAPFSILAAGTLWGTMGIFVRNLSALGFSLMEIVALRSALTAITMTILLLIFNPSSLKIRSRDIWCFIGTGWCSILFFNFCYFQTIMLSTLAVAATLLYTAPIFLTVLSVLLFKEKITPLTVFAIFLAFIGCLMVTGVLGQSVFLSAAALLAGLGSSIGYALYSVFSRYAIARGYGPLTITAYTFIAASIGAIPLTDISGMAVIIYQNSNLWALSILFCVVTTVFPYILYTMGLRYVQSWQAGVIASIEPVVAAFLGVIIFNEKISMLEVVGMLTVIGAMALTNVHAKN